jgi:hypothetical protein
MKTTQLFSDGKSKREFETEEWGIKHTTKKFKKGVDKHVE